MFETTVSQYDLEDGYSIKFVHDRDWEMSIPVSFRAYKDGDELFESAVVCGIDSDGVVGFKRDIVVERVNGIGDVYIIYNKNKPNEVLAFVDFRKGIYYPKGNVNPTEYERIGDDFARIQDVIGKEKELKNY